MGFISPKINHDRPPICVDFDGVIHAYSRGFADGTIYDGPTDGVAKAMIKLKKKYYVYVNSQRSGTPEGKKAIEEYLAKYEIPYDEIAMTKPAAKFYIDDRGIRFKSWNQVLKEIENFEQELKLKATN